MTRSVFRGCEGVKIILEVLLPGVALGRLSRDGRGIGGVDGVGEREVYEVGSTTKSTEVGLTWMRITTC